jgi:hypothetical protein
VEEVRKNVAGQVWKVVGYTIALVAFVITVLAGFTQSKLFKERLRLFLISSITTNTNAAVNLGTIRGNFITGFSVDSVALFIDGEEFLTTGKVDISYDFLSLPRKRISVQNLTIEHPRFVLQRGATDSLWNIGKFIRQDEVESVESKGTDAPSSFNWTIQIDRLRLINGSAVVKDLRTLSSPEHPPALPHQLEYHDLSIENVNLASGVKFNGSEAYLAVEELSLDLRQPEFTLRRLTGEFAVSPSGVAAQSLVIETRKTQLNLSASLEKVNLFDGIELEQLRDKSIQLKLLADNISLNELKSFIAPIDFLEGSAYVDLDVQGTFGNFTINRLNLQTYNTALQLRGTLRNLHRPDDLFLDVNISNSTLNPGDAHKLLPSFHIPRFENAGRLLVNARYTGKPLNFSSKVSIEGEIGNVEADAALNLEHEQMQYDCAFRTTNLNARKTWNDLPFHSLLTSRGTIRGIGTSMDNIAADVQVAIDSTTVQNMLLTASEITMQLRKRSIKSRITLNSPEARVALSGSADFPLNQPPLVRVEGTVNNLNLASLLNDPHYSSSISFRAAADIRGSHIDDVSGNLTMNFLASSFQTYQFDDQRCEVNIERYNGDSTKFSLSSPVADITLSGRYSVSQFMEFLSNEYGHISQAIDDRVASFLHDTSSSPGESSRNKLVLSPHAQNPTPFSAEFSFTVKDLKPLSVFLGGTPFNGRGTLRGGASFDNGQFSLACTTAIAQMFVGSVDQGVFFEKSDLLLSLTSSETKNATNYLDHVTLDLKAYAHHGIINKGTLDQAAATISYRNDKTHYNFLGTVDSLSKVLIEGSVRPSQHAYHFSIDSTVVTFGDLFWVNNGNIVGVIDKSGFRVTNFDLRKKHNDHEYITLQGTVDYFGALDCQLHVQQFNLRNFGHYVNVQELLSERGFTGTVDLDTKIQGTVQAPEMRFVATGSGITYRGKKIGMLIGTLDYRDRLLTVDVGIGNPKPNEARPTDLVVRGNVPIDLALSGVEQRFPDKPMNLLVSSEGLEIDFLDPLLVSLDDLRGRLVCNLHIGGTPGRPLYNGTISLSDVEFLFVPNNVHYLVSGAMEASGEQRQSVNIQIKNDRKDRSDGIASVEGTVTIRNFTIESFDLAAQGQLLLMKETTRRTARTMYGTLFASIGTEGLRYRGTFDRSYLSGTVYVRQANLVFPPTRESGVAREPSLNYVFVNDTLQRDPFKEKLSEEFFVEHSNGGFESAKTAKTRTIWDGMWYDVVIETQGTTEIRMVFNQSTNEELFAALEGRVILQRGEEGPRMNGVISVGERSYYNFFKKFSANGTLKFVGQPDDPELNITALYESVRTVDTTGTDQKKPEQRVVVTLDISGTRYEPKLAMSMTVDGEPRSGDVQSDAIPFILTGKFLDDLSSQEKSDILTSLGSTAGGSILYGLPSQMLSGVLSDFLQKEIPIIRRAEITYRGGNIQESADLRLTGEIGKAYWRAGGRIFNNIGNANVSVQFSMGDVFERPSLRNLFLELERKVEGSEGEDQRKLTNAARIFFRISF